MRYPHEYNDVKFKDTDKYAKDEDTGNYKLTAVGCFMRHDTPRDKQYLTNDEAKRSNPQLIDYGTRFSAEELELITEQPMGFPRILAKIELEEIPLQHRISTLKSLVLKDASGKVIYYGDPRQERRRRNG